MQLYIFNMGRSFSWWARTVFTFSFGFCLGLVLHIFVIFTIEMNKTQKLHVSSNIHMNEINSQSDLKRQPLKTFAHGSPDGGGNGVGPRILCYVLTGPTTHQASLHVKNTWGQRCDKTIFFSTQWHPELQPELLKVPEGYAYLWAKAKAAVRHLHHHHPSYDWYLKADDDTFVIVENLRYFLRDKDPIVPIYYGVKFKQHVKQGFMSGGGGYVMSKEAIKRFVTEALNISDQELCPSNGTRGAEDVNLGLCLEAVGVIAGDSRDESEKPRFFSHNPMSLFYKAPIINKFHWYWRYLWYSHDMGPDCCSPHLISFHDIDARMMWTLETLLYRTIIHRELQPVNSHTDSSIVSSLPKASLRSFPLSLRVSSLFPYFSTSTKAASSALLHSSAISSSSSSPPSSLSYSSSSPPSSLSSSSSSSPPSSLSSSSSSPPSSLSFSSSSPPPSSLSSSSSSSSSSSPPSSLSSSSSLKTTSTSITTTGTITSNITAAASTTTTATFVTATTDNPVSTNITANSSSP